MSAWKNLDTLDAWKAIEADDHRVDIKEALTGEAGGKRMAECKVPMAAGMTYYYGAKAVDEELLNKLTALAKEAELTEKYKELYEGAVINTGEKRLVLHQLTRGELGDPVIADGIDKRDFYLEQQRNIAVFAEKVYSGEIVNENGGRFTTVVQIGIGGSDLGPRAMYLALENWAKKNGSFRMEARFISNVDPDDAAGVLGEIDPEKTTGKEQRLSGCIFHG